MKTLKLSTFNGSAAVPNGTREGVNICLSWLDAFSPTINSRHPLRLCLRWPKLSGPSFLVRRARRLALDGRLQTRGPTAFGFGMAGLRPHYGTGI